jgi:endonuclease IV
MKIGLAASFYSAFSLNYVANNALEAGFDGVEIDIPQHLGCLFENRLNCPILSMHLPKIPTANWLFFCGILAVKNKIPVLVTHPAIEPVIMRVFARIFSTYNITVTIENVPRLGERLKRANISNRFKQLLLPEESLLERYNKIPVTFDVGHAFSLRQDPAQQITELGKRIAHIHLSDSLGGDNHLPIGQGSIDFRKVFEALNKLNYSNSVILEANAENMKTQLILIKDLIKETA